MCGIVGYTGRGEALPFLIDGLKHLEYRGYDSAGIAIIQDGKILRKRAQGKIDRLESLLGQSSLLSHTAIGHTRWATHGRPSEENAHPHADCTKTVVVVHNGIIENYLEIRKELLGKGHVFESETDTEVIAHLIEENLKNAENAGKPPLISEKTFLEAVKKTASRLRGSYALAILSSRCPGTIIAIKTASPLIIGLGNGENFLASDVPAFLSRTRDVVFLEDGEIAVLTAGRCSYFRLTGSEIKKTAVRIDWDLAMAEKGGYPHFML